MADTPTRCPDPEVLAAYIDRGLSLAERSRVDHHLASCHQCIALVAGVVRTVADVSEFTPHAEPAVETASRAVTRRTLVGVLAAAAAVIAVVFTPSFTRTWQDRETGLVNLGGVSEQRSVLGRLTGGFPHAPLGVPSAGGQDGRVAGTDRILLTSAKIRESFGERDTPSRLHDLGLSQLLAGRYDDAAHALLAASREQPGNARFLNDVAAVQLERARLGLRPDDLPRALASADRARRLDPSLNEAWFNRALAATALSLRDQARTAWTEYLSRDSSSAWAVEARERLQELSKPTPVAAWEGMARQLEGEITIALAESAVRAQMTEARNLVETELLPAWAAAVEGGRDASRELNGLRNLGQAFASIGGDQLYRDAVAVIDGAGSDAQRRALARGHAAYATAAALFAEDRFADAAVALASARDGLTDALSPFAYRATLDLSAATYFLGRGAEATKLLEALDETARTRGYAHIAARTTWQMGLIAFGQGRLAEAQSHYEQTLAAFERMGDAELAANAHGLLAALHQYLGDATTAWRHRLAAFDGLSVSRSFRLKHALMASAAAAIYQDAPDTALALQDQALANAMAWKRDAAIAEVHAQRAATLLALGRTVEAEKNVAAARRHLPAIPDAAFRSRVEVAVLTTESDLLLKRDPRAAADAASKAIAIVQQRRDRLRLAQLHLRLAKANVVWGNLQQAQLALDRGIQSFDEERASLADEGRISTLDESWQLFDTAVRLSIKKGDYTRAFALSERARARTLAETRQLAVRSLEEVQAALPADQAVVALNQFDDELAVWVIRRDTVDVMTRPVRRVDAQQLVARQQTEIWHGSDTPVAGRELFDQILRPASIQLRGATRLVIIPDATYADAAFSALWDESRGRFLIEDRTVSLAASVTAVANAALADAIGGGDGQPLIVGEPGLNADAVAGVYAEPTVVTGSAATRARLLTDVREHAVVHMSAQTAANAAYPLLSRVLLADELGRRHSGAMLGRDIAAQSLSHTKLVVLDEVDTTSENRGDGTLSLARAFLTAGVRTVVGTLPGADEAAVRDLMVGFHRRLASGMPAAEALTELQRNVLRSNGHRLGAWSALVLYGSDR